MADIILEGLCLESIATSTSTKHDPPSNVSDVCIPPNPAGMFSEDGEVITLHIDGSLTIPKPGIKRYTYANTKIAQALGTLGRVKGRRTRCSGKAKTAQTEQRFAKYDVDASGQITAVCPYPCCI